MAVGVAELARVLLQQAVEGSPKIHVTQVGGENALAIVIVDRSSIEHCVANAQVEQAGIATAGPAAFNRRDITDPVRVGEHLHHRLINDKAVEIPLAVKNRDNANSNLTVSDLEQRRIRVGISSGNRQPVKVQAQV